MIKDLVRKEAKGLAAVQWGEYAGESIRLFWGESPVEPPPAVQERIAQAARFANRYPDPEQQELRAAVAQYAQAPPQCILFGNGSDSLIEIVAKTFVSAGDEALIPQPSFITYANVARLMGGVPIFVDLDRDFCLDIEKLLAAITPRTKVVFIANPNNPTGNYLVDEDGARRILEALRGSGILVVDECYFELGKMTVRALLEEFDNLLILRSFSKGLALAGARIGYALGSAEAISYLKRVQQIPQVFEVNSFAQAAALEALRCREEILAAFFSAKASFLSLLAKIPNIAVRETSTSFLILDLSEAGVRSRDAKLALEGRGILTKDCSAFPNFGEHYLYLGIPATKDQERVALALREIVSAGSRSRYQDNIPQRRQAQ